MILKDFFDKLFLMQKSPNERLAAYTDNKPYQGFRHLEQLVVAGMEDYLQDKHSEWFEENKKELRKHWRMTIGATVLVTAEMEAREKQGKSERARQIPSDELVWKQAVKLLTRI